MKENKDIEDLFKDKFEDFEADVNPDVWKNVRTALKGFGLGLLVKTLINKIGTNTIIAVVSSAVTVISTVFVMNSGDNKKEQTVEHQPVVAQQTTVAQQQVVNPIKNNTIAAAEKHKTDVAETKEISEVPATQHISHIAPVDKKEMESIINKYSNKNLIADISASPVAGELPLQVSLMNKGTGKNNKWSFGDSKKIETDPSPVHFYNEPGIYTVKLVSTDAEGKTSIDSVKIEVVGNPSIASEPPTEISPDGDGNLDEFAINPINIKDVTVIIFDKGGNIVYQWEGIDGKWDGKNLKGKAVNEGMYFYIINAVGLGGKKFEKNGSIRLTRKKLLK